MKTIKDMSVLITGGGSGIGAGTARFFVQGGARVTISGRREDKLRAVAGSIGPACTYVVGDVTNAADRARMIDTAVAHGGGLHALINNAANMYQGPLTSLTEAGLQDIFNTNVVAAMLLTGLAVPHLEATQGAVVLMGSVHTRRAYPGASPYAATKGAVEVLARVLAAELGPKQIRVNCVLPGAVPTELNTRAGVCTEDELKIRMRNIASSHALGRIGTEAEVADAIAHLCCATWTTGASLVVDGGLALGVSNFN